MCLDTESKCTFNQVGVELGKMFLALIDKKSDVFLYVMPENMFGHVGITSTESGREKRHGGDYLTMIAR
jgi:hypothetical protein